MSKLTITLVDRQRKDVAKLEIEVGVKTERVAGATMIVYKGRYYAWSQLEGKWPYMGAVYMEANPPVHITDKGGVC